MMRLLAVLALYAAPAAAQEPAVPAYVGETVAAGIGGTYAGDWEYMVGGGAAAFDCNTDGYPDLLLSGGTDPARFYRNVATKGSSLAFAEETSGLELTGVTQTYPLDVDADGITDLALLRIGETVLMRGLGDCRFARANEDWSFDGGNAWWSAFAATWEDGQNWPTLALGGYIDRQEEAFPWGSCTENRLYRPGATGFAGVQRPRILQGRRRTTVAHSSRATAPLVDSTGRVAAPADLGHGHRQPRLRCRWLP